MSATSPFRFDGILLLGVGALLFELFGWEATLYLGLAVAAVFALSLVWHGLRVPPTLREITPCPSKAGVF